MPKLQTRHLVVDANSVIMRAVMATVLDDYNSDGKYVSGVYGALNILRTIVGDPSVRAGRIYAFFDNGVPTERLAVLPGYKAHRKDRDIVPPDELEKAYAQIQTCWNLFPFLGIQCFSFKQREADDGVAAACRILASHDQTPLAVTSDADLYQVVNYGGQTYDFGKKHYVTLDSFREVTGTDPWMYLVYRAMCGDSSDGIVGVHGLGPKRAAALLDEVSEEHDGTLIPDLFADLDPHQQLESLCSIVRQREKRRGYEDALLEAEERLESVLLGIDLSTSFGGTRSLETAMFEPVEVKPTEFLRTAKKLGMTKILANAPKWAKPFTDANARGQRALTPA